MTFSHRRVSRRRLVQSGLGAGLAVIVVGVQLGAVGSASTVEQRLASARIAASDSRHLGLLGTWAGKRPIGPALPEPLDAETAADVLSSYLV